MAASVAFVTASFPGWLSWPSTRRKAPRRPRPARAKRMWAMSLDRRESRKTATTRAATPATSRAERRAGDIARKIPAGVARPGAAAGSRCGAAVFDNISRWIRSDTGGREAARESRGRSAASANRSPGTDMKAFGLPSPQGLYDPANEHDACGFGFVVDVKARPSHDIVRKALQVLSNLEHRGATGSEKNTGDGAGLLTQIPHAFVAGWARADRHRAAAAGRLRPRDALPPGGGGEPPGLPAEARGDRRRGRAAGPRVAGRPDRQRVARRDGPREPARHPAAARRPRRGDGGGRRLRAEALRHPPPRREGRLPLGPRGARHLLRREPLVADRRLQGDAERRPARGLLPRPLGGVVHLVPRDGPLALLDEHVPQLVALAPLPLHLAQRRDQHAARERELDAGAAADVRVEALRRRPEEGPAGHRHRRLRLVDVRQRPRAARPRGALAARTR